MKIHRNINLWHYLSLVLAFIAGAAVFSNPRWFGGVSLIADQALVSENTDVADSDPIALAARDGSQSSGAELSAPENLPIYLQNEIEDLREQVEIAREKIDELTLTVSNLSAEVESERGNQESINALQDAATEQQPVVAAAAAPAPNRRRRNRGINRDALVQTGVDSLLIENLQQRQDEQALARLNLLDRAAREGYSGSDRLENELDELRESSPNLQEELGDDAYDQYLYNAGNTNRIQVSSIISGSIASLVGIELGDIIYQYGSTRVFNTRGLVSAIREGVRDETVLVSIIREGQPLVVDVTRAPLGVSLNRIRLEPGF